MWETHDSQHDSVLEGTFMAPSWASLCQSLVGSLLFLPGPGAHTFLFVSSKSLFPQSSVSSGGSMVELMVSSSRRAYTIPRSTALRAAGPVRPLLAWTSAGDTQTHFWLSLCRASVSCLVYAKFVWALWVSLAGMRFDSKCNFSPSTILLGLLLCPWMWGVIFWWDATFSYWWLFSSKL